MRFTWKHKWRTDVQDNVKRQLQKFYMTLGEPASMPFLIPDEPASEVRPIILDVQNFEMDTGWFVCINKKRNTLMLFDSTTVDDLHNKLDDWEEVPFMPATKAVYAGHELETKHNEMILNHAYDLTLLLTDAMAAGIRSLLGALHDHRFQLR